MRRYLLFATMLLAASCAKFVEIGGYYPNEPPPPVLPITEAIKAQGMSQYLPGFQSCVITSTSVIYTYIEPYAAPQDSALYQIDSVDRYAIQAYKLIYPTKPCNPRQFEIVFNVLFTSPTCKSMAFSYDTQGEPIIWVYQWDMSPCDVYSLY